VKLDSIPITAKHYDKNQVKKWLAIALFGGTVGRREMHYSS